MKVQEYNNKLLTEISCERYNWANRASERYINDFSSDNRIDLNLKNEIIVAILGSTQVGKTTLILNLLGVKPEYIDSISKALRGKRETGNSATIAVTRYISVEEENFIIIYPGTNESKELKDIKALEEELYNLRFKVENNLYTTHDVMTIGIPESMINKTHNINIIDLPGSESRQTEEFNYVKSANEFWIFNAHVKIVAVNGTDLTFLRDMKTLEGMHSIDLNDSDTIALITKACSPKSVIDRFNDHNLQDANDIRKYYYEQIKDINTIDSINYDKIFISDFYVPEQISDKNKFNKISNQALEGLIFELQKMGENITSYSQLKKYYSFVKKSNDFIIRDLTEIKKIYTDKKSKVNSILENLSELIICDLEEYNNTIEEIKLLTKGRIIFAEKSFLLNFYSTENFNEDQAFSFYDKKTTETLKKFTYDFFNINDSYNLVIDNTFKNNIMRLSVSTTQPIDQVKKFFDNVITNHNKITKMNINSYNNMIKKLEYLIVQVNGEQLSFKKINFKALDIDTEIRIGFFGSLFGNKEDTYINNLKDEYHVQTKKMNDMIYDIVDYNIKIIEEWLENYNSEILNKLNRKIKLAENHLKKYKEIVGELLDIDKEIKNIEVKNDMDKKHSLECRKYFEEEGKKQLEIYFSKMKSSNNVLEIVKNQLLLDILIHKDFNQIIESVDIN
ncbi:hypothetical protein ETI06_00235 [Macrococcoides goetzii]|nr:hypothetical protein [Macrococcus goetzii]TDM50438.1 hypothetical protein ETI06_00235 [Macrococcus goetzii]